MTDFTLGGKFGCFGRRSYAPAWSWWSSHSKAVLPKPVAASRSIWRREIGFIPAPQVQYLCKRRRGVRTRACRVETRLDAFFRTQGSCTQNGVEMSLDAARTSAYATLDVNSCTETHSRRATP